MCFFCFVFTSCIADLLPLWKKNALTICGRRLLPICVLSTPIVITKIINFMKITKYLLKLFTPHATIHILITPK